MHWNCNWIKQTNNNERVQEKKFCKQKVFCPIGGRTALKEARGAPILQKRKPVSKNNKIGMSALLDRCCTVSYKSIGLDGIGLDGLQVGWGNIFELGPSVLISFPQ